MTNQPNRHGSATGKAIQDNASATAGGPIMIDGWEVAAKAVGWSARFSHFTTSGVSIAYVDWKTLCLAEGIAKAEGRSNG